MAQRIHTLDEANQWQGASLYLHEAGSFVPLARHETAIALDVRRMRRYVFWKVTGAGACTTAGMDNIQRSSLSTRRQPLALLS
ncbi:hypothetical protein Tamer19_32580 [Cupriavidus sp. TA19]|nr:hypothetical protein Tamer19_32580 [Cupriavidus sp. TA19]